MTTYNTIYNIADRDLRSTIREWMRKCAGAYYDTDEDAVEDLLATVKEEALHYVDARRENPR